MPRRAHLMAVAFVVVSLGRVAGPAQGQNIINNGSFEAGSVGVQHFPDWDWIGPAGDNASDYGVTNATGGANVAEQGNQFAYFHGHPTDGSQDCLGQSVYLKIGAQYQISYYLGTDGPTAGSGASMWVVIGTSFGIDYSADIALPSFFPDSSNALPYQLFTTNITATTNAEILSFHGIDAASSILLDNVSMSLLTPTLNASVSSGSGLVFSWAGTNSGFHLQANGTLGTTNWVTLTNQPTATGANSEIALPAPATNAFYRLIQ